MPNDTPGLVSVTIRLTNAEFTINPDMQTMRIQELDGVGRAMGQVDEMSLHAAIGALRGLIRQRKEAPHAAE